MKLKQKWDAGFLEKYQVMAPRYTSYPTANLFHEQFSAEDYIKACGKQKNCISPISVYVHIPFCERACFYCGCNRVITRDRERIQNYLQALYEEIRLRGKLHGHRRVLQLHWGGGTPSYLDPSQMTELMHELAMNFELDGSESRDFSIEIDPRTVAEQSIALICGLGFNRISLGIQDFDPQVQKAINRIQSYESICRLMVEIRKFGFDSVNFDLIYGLPRQNCQTMDKTLDQVLALKPDRIACYNYAHMPDRFPAQRAISSTALPDGMEKIRLYGMISSRLIDAGYVHIGLDHFARREDSLAKAVEEGKLQRNFQGYSRTLANDLVGLGASAISEIGHCYAQNAKDIQAYLAALDKGNLPVAKGMELNDKDRLRKKIIQSICCNLSLDTEAIEKEFGISFRQTFGLQLESIKAFEKDGLVKWDGKVLRVSYSGRFILRNICMLFDEYLYNSPTSKFSKVV